MDLRVFYKKIRELEATITEPDVVVISRETPDGGKAGVRTVVPRRLAAKMVVEEKAVLATPEQAMEFREEIARSWKKAQEAPALSEGEVRALRNALKPQKKA